MRTIPTVCLCALLAACITLSLPGCGNQPPSDPNGNSNTTDDGDNINDNSGANDNDSDSDSPNDNDGDGTTDGDGDGTTDGDGDGDGTTDGDGAIGDPCDSVADCEDGLVCHERVCAEDDAGPTSLIVAASRAGRYVIVDPETGEGLVENAPDVVTLNDCFFGYNTQRVFITSPATDTTYTIQLYSVDAMTGEDLQQVTSFSAGLGAVTVDSAPFGETLVMCAYEDTDENSLTHIYTMTETGQEMTQLTFGDEVLELADGSQVQSIEESLPAWSPDGTKIAYLASTGLVESIGTRYTVVIVMDADGSNKEIIYERSGSAGFKDVAWLYGGEFVLLIDTDSIRDLRAVHVESKTVTTLTDQILDEGQFGNMWPSPLDYRVAYNKYVPGAGQLYETTLTPSGNTVTATTGIGLTDSSVGYGHAEPHWVAANSTVDDSEDPVDTDDCTSDIDCEADEVCEGGVCVQAEIEEGSYIVAASRAGRYVIVDPETGEGLVENAPDVVTLNDCFFGYNTQRVFITSPATDTTYTIQLYSVDAMTGEDLQQVTSFSAGLGAVTVDSAPFGETLVMCAYEDTDENSLTHIYTMTETGQEMTQLTFGDEVLELADGSQVQSIEESLPAWSPDGTKIAYLASTGLVESIGTRFTVVIVMDADGSNKKIIYERSGSAGFKDVAWLYGGEFVLLIDTDSIRDLRAVHVESKTVTTLTDQILDEGQFGNMWPSPLDYRVAYNKYVPGAGQLYETTLTPSGNTVTATTGIGLTDSSVGYGHAEPHWVAYGQ